MENNRCKECNNYIGGLTCLAFDNIPTEILEGNNDHLKPLDSQANNVHFEEIKQPFYSRPKRLNNG